jgi:hypothetical protein
VGVLVAACIVYILRVMFRAKRMTGYIPDFENWTWYTLVPLVAYGAIFASAVALPAAPIPALFALAGGVVLLIFTGIRNAWDVVTYIAIAGSDQPPE